MTFFAVAIIVPPPFDQDLIMFACQQMRPYDQSLIVEPYVCYSIDHAAKEIAAQIEKFSRNLEGEIPAYQLACREYLAELKATTPEARYKDRIRFFTRFDRDGRPVSQKNPHGKWDYYFIGGRFDGWIHDRECKGRDVGDNVASVEHAIVHRKVTHAIITPDGLWHERETISPSGIVTDKGNRESEALALLGKYPGHEVLIIDAHV